MPKRLRDEKKDHYWEDELGKCTSIIKVCGQWWSSWCHHDEYHDDYLDDHHNDYHYDYHDDDVNHSGIILTSRQTQYSDSDSRCLRKKKFGFINNHIDLFFFLSAWYQFVSSDLDSIWNCPNHMINHPTHYSFASVNLLIVQL